VSTNPSAEDGNRSGFRNVAFFGASDDGKVQNPVILVKTVDVVKFEVLKEKEAEKEKYAFKIPQGIILF
jgi:hypothetical protein